MIITKSEPFTKEEIQKLKNKQLLGALAMDLKRVALGYFRGSTIMAERFFIEAVKRKTEIDGSTLKPYLRKLLVDMETLSKSDEKKAADEALFYSTMFQNAATLIS
jgi:hypothetical protein